MREVVIKYKNQKTLKALAALGEYLGFTIADSGKEPKKEKMYHINGIPVERGDPQIDIQELTSIFTETDIDSKTLRESSWQRKK